MAKNTQNTLEAEAQAVNIDNTDLQPMNAAEGESKPESGSAAEDDEGNTGESDNSKKPDKKKKAALPVSSLPSSTTRLASPRL